jgi:pimeloyl-ACP methyl ester carboxylesterase
VTREVCVAGNRRVAFEIWGSAAGTPVFLVHGTPGSRSGPRPRSSVLYRLGIRLVSYDRPGYGRSDPQPGRTVSDAAADIHAIADELELDTFGVVGRSGGGPHALACAALLGDRVERAACLVGLAPLGAEDLDWYAGMAASNTWEYRNGDIRELRARLAERVQRIREDPQKMLELLADEVTNSDKSVLSDIAIQRLLTDTYQEAVREGGEGWVDDILALRRPWGFDPASIKVPVLLWHGADDVFSPASHTVWLARQIPGSIVAVQRGAAHFSAFGVLPSVLAWIKDPSSSEGLGIQNAHQPALLS